MNTSYKREPITRLSTPHLFNLGELTETLKSNLRLLDGHLLSDSTPCMQPVIFAKYIAVRH